MSASPSNDPATFKRQTFCNKSMNAIAFQNTAQPSRAVSTRPVVGFRLALSAVSFILFVLWARTAFVPGASTGDEVWWSESGYFFMKEGVLRWACMANDKGAGLISYWPPIPALLQALMMKVFGVNAFGIMAQSSLVSSLAMLATYCLGRALSWNRTKSLWATVAIFGLFSVDRRMTMGRMENLTALSALVFALLMLLGSQAEGRRRQGLEIAAGLVLGLGFFSYYPQSPFLALAACATIAILHPTRLAQCAANVALGALPVVIAAVAWITPHWELFRRQVLEVGAAHYVSSHVIWDCIQLLWKTSNGLNWVQHIERWVVLVFSTGCFFWLRSPALRALSAVAAILTLPMFAYTWSANVVSAGPPILGVILLFALSCDDEERRFAAGLDAIRWGLVFAACLKMGLVAFTAYYQREGRNYEVVASALRETIQGDDPVGIEQRAWLGLRDRIAADRLHLLVDVGTTLGFMPEVAARKNADEYFRFLVLEKEIIPYLGDDYPWLKRGIESGRFRLIKEIAPTFRPLPWAKEPCYDLLVYERKTD